ncbi:MAG TPA: UTP--glucose-1-phosphate uridylyltransferase GalU [Acidimicrobiales bacterium]|nr:UTP--glucose-1-phosphate uridylyltransferase GalU [Acidimicrobiales bacterium]
MTVNKAVIPAAGLGTRFLPATKAQPKEMLPVVDKPAIQYVVEEAARCGIRDILVVTGRNKKSLEDHFDHVPELESQLEASGKHDLLALVHAATELADLHYVRQGKPKGLGHAVAVARQHVGNEPFVVLLPDDIMETSDVLSRMLDAHATYGASVVALKEVAEHEISSYGCAEVEPVGDGLVRITGVVEKPSPEEAPSNLAVMGRYVFTPDIFDLIDKVEPGKGGEIQLTDAMAMLPELYGVVFQHGRYDTGNKLDYLRATVELALKRDDLGPDFRAYLSDLARRENL